MATHVLWQADVADFDVWLKIFRENKPMRDAAGIRELHVWREPGKTDHAVALFEISDPDRARTFFESEELAMYQERGGVAHVAVRVLSPA